MIRLSNFTLLLGLAFMLIIRPECSAQGLMEALAYLDGERFQPEVFLPYVADPARQKQIFLQMNTLAPTMHVENVRAAIGAPDEIRAIMAPGERTEELEGFEYVYILQRSKSEEWGKAYDERTITLGFDLAGKLRSAYGYDVQGFNEIARPQGLSFEFSTGLHERVQLDELVVRLDQIVDAASAQRTKVKPGTKAIPPHVVLSVSLPDRKGQIKLGSESIGADYASTKQYGKFEITLVQVLGPDRVILIVK